MSGQMLTLCFFLYLVSIMLYHHHYHPCPCRAPYVVQPAALLVKVALRLGSGVQAAM